MAETRTPSSTSSGGYIVRRVLTDTEKREEADRTCDEQTPFAKGVHSVCKEDVHQEGDNGLCDGQ